MPANRIPAYTRRLPGHPLLPLRPLRLRANLSLERLAVAASLTAQTLYRLEMRPDAYRAVSMYTVTRIAQALGVPVVEICPWLAHVGPFPPTVDDPAQPIDDATDPLDNSTQTA